MGAHEEKRIATKGADDAEGDKRIATKGAKDAKRNG